MRETIELARAGERSGEHRLLMPKHQSPRASGSRWLSEIGERIDPLLPLERATAHQVAPCLNNAALAEHLLGRPARALRMLTLNVRCQAAFADNVAAKAIGSMISLGRLLDRPRIGTSDAQRADAIRRFCRLGELPAREWSEAFPELEGVAFGRLLITNELARSVQRRLDLDDLARFLATGTYDVMAARADQAIEDHPERSLPFVEASLLAHASARRIDTGRAILAEWQPRARGLAGVVLAFQARVTGVDGEEEEVSLGDTQALLRVCLSLADETWAMSALALIHAMILADDPLLRDSGRHDVLQAALEAATTLGDERHTTRLATLLGQSPPAIAGADDLNAVSLVWDRRLSAMSERLNALPLGPEAYDPAVL